MNTEEIKKIKETVEEFFSKMTIEVQKIDVNFFSAEKNGKEDTGEEREAVDLSIKLDEPQILIGQSGQTLFETQRLLKTILNKKLQKIFFLNLDINDYKKNKIEYLKGLAKELADSVALTKQEKVLFPMPAYERRIIHAELSERQDVTTESQGEGIDRHIVIKPK